MNIKQNTLDFSNFDNSRIISALYNEGRTEDALKLIIGELVSDPRMLQFME